MATYKSPKMRCRSSEKLAAMTIKPSHLLGLCKHVVLHLLGHDVLRQRLQLGGQELDGPLPHHVVALQDLREEAGQGTCNEPKESPCQSGTPSTDWTDPCDLRCVLQILYDSFLLASVQASTEMAVLLPFVL